MLGNRCTCSKQKKNCNPIILTDGKLSYSLAHPSSSSSLEMSSSLTAKAARALPAGGLGFLLLDGALLDVCIATPSLSFLVLRFTFFAAFTSGLEAGFLAAFLVGALSLPEALSKADRLEVGLVFDPFNRLEEVSDISSDF